MSKPFSILLIVLSFFCSIYIYAETEKFIDRTDVLNEYAINDQLIIDLKDASPSTVESLLNSTLEKGVSFDNYKKMILLVGKHSNSDYAIENINLLLKYVYKPYPAGQEYGGEEEYYTLLEWATQNNKTKLMTFIFEKAVSWKKEYHLPHLYDEAFEALKEFSVSNDKTALQKLINHGFEVNNYDFRTPRMFDIAQKCYEGEEQEKSRMAFKKLIQFGINLNLQDKEEGETILHRVAHEGTQKAFDFFKKLGVDPLLKNSKGKTADAIFNKRKLIKIIEEGTPFELKEIINQGVALDGEWYLQKAAKNTNKQYAVEKFQLLLDSDYEPKPSYSSSFNQPMHIACKTNNIALMKIILKYREGLKQSLSQFYTSAFEGLSEAPNKNGSALQLLIDNGLDINNAKNILYLFEFARLTYGVKKSDKYKKSLKNLVSYYGVNMNQQNEHGNTVLHIAAQIAWDKEQSFLIQIGVDPQIKNIANQTAREILEKRRHWNYLEKAIPIIISVVTVVALILSFMFGHKLNSGIRNFSRSWPIRIAFSAVSSFVIGLLISMIVGSGGNQFEGGQGLGIVFLAFVTVPVSFFALLIVKNPATQVTLILFSLSVVFTGFFFLL